jgi:hypothetical protein
MALVSAALLFVMQHAEFGTTEGAVISLVPALVPRPQQMHLKCVITVSGSCTKYPQVSDKTFDDSAYGGPKQVSAEVCVARGKSWGRDCAPAVVNVEMEGGEKSALDQIEIRRWVRKDGDVALPEIQAIDSHPRTKSCHSSKMELAWVNVNGRQRGHICSTAKALDQQAAATLWLQYSQRAWLPGGKPAPIPSVKESAVLSIIELCHSKNWRRVHRATERGWPAPFRSSRM